MASGSQPGRRAGRGALQGDPAGVRHPLRSREAQGVRRGRPLRRLRRGRVSGGRRLPGRRRGPRRRLRLGSRRHLLDVLPRAPTGPARAAGPRPGVRGSPELRPGDARHTDRRLRADDRRVPDLPRQRRPTRDLPAHLPALRGHRHRRPEPGPLLDLTALPRVRWPGQHHRGPLPDLLGQRRDAGDQALPRQHPRRRPRRQPDQARRQGRGRLSGRTTRRSLRDDAGRSLSRLQAARRTATSRSTSR